MNNIVEAAIQELKLCLENNGVSYGTYECFADVMVLSECSNAMLDSYKTCIDFDILYSKILPLFKARELNLIMQTIKEYGLSPICNVLFGVIEHEYYKQLQLEQEMQNAV